MMDHTTPEARRLYFAVLRLMTPSDRFEMSMKMSWQVKEMKFRAIRNRNPEYIEEQVKFIYLHHLLGPKDFKKLFPNVDWLP